MNRAYSIFTVKAVDDEQRVITGTATTPEPDRIGDIVEPLGVKFKNPLPLLLFHDGKRPVGVVKFDKPTDNGITFSAKLPEVDEPGTLRDRVQEAWQSLKLGLIRGVSIGFRVLDDGIELMRNGGYRFTKTEVVELSLVTVPANADCTIATIKSLDAESLALSGATSNQPAAAGTSRKRAGRMKKSIAERLTLCKSERAAKFEKMTGIVDEQEDGKTLEAAEQEEFNTLRDEVKALDEEIERLEWLDQATKKAAKPAAGDTVERGAAARDGNSTSVIVRERTEPGIGFARAVMVKANAFIHNRYVLDVAKDMYPHDERIHAYVKGAIAAGTTTSTPWAGVFVDPTNLTSEFIEYLRPKTIIGQFGTGNIPSLTRVPFNVRILGQTTGGSAYWVGQGAPKPLTAFEFSATTLGFAKIANIAVITEELARFSSPSAEARVRDSLAKAIIERMDRDFVDPAHAAVTNVNPASITNGINPLAVSGTDADAVRADIQTLLGPMLEANIDPTTIVLIMPTTTALALSLMRNSLGQPEFEGLTMRGGTLVGIPVITSQYVANESGYGNIVVAVNAADVFLSDDGQVTVKASREASLQMLDNPTNNSATATATTMVSMFQTDSIALLAERYVNWARARTEAVQWLDDVAWGGAGSPT